MSRGKNYICELYSCQYTRLFYNSGCRMLVQVLCWKYFYRQYCGWVLRYLQIKWASEVVFVFTRYTKPVVKPLLDVVSGPQCTSWCRQYEAVGTRLDGYGLNGRHMVHKHQINFWVYSWRGNVYEANVSKHWLMLYVVLNVRLPSCEIIFQKYFLIENVRILFFLVLYFF